MKYRLAEARHGFMFYNPHDVYVGRSFERYGEFSEGEIGMFRELVGPEDIVIDIGANIGAHTVWFAQRAQHVIAFEPQRLVYQMLCANLVVNNLHNVSTYQAVVGPQPGQCLVPVLPPDQDNNFGGLWGSNHTEGEPVPVVALDQFPLPRVNFIKIDVEGMETEVLKGARGMIDHFKPILYVEDDREEQREALRALITSMDYEFEEHNTMLFNPENFKDEDENVFDQAASFNLVCSPKGAIRSSVIQ